MVDPSRKIFFLDEPQEITNVSIDDWNDLMGYRLDRAPQGTLLLNIERSNRVLDYLESREEPYEQPEDTAYPRLYNAAGIHLVHKLIRLLAQEGPQPLDTLVRRSDDITFRPGAKQPQARIPELIRLAEALQLVRRDQRVVELTPLGREYAHVGADDAHTVTPAQADLLRRQIIDSPRASLTFLAIVATARLLSERNTPAGEEDIQNALIEQLGAERLGATTRQIWTRNSLQYVNQLGLASDGSITTLGQEFLAELSRRVAEGAQPGAVLERGGDEPPIEREYVIGRRASRGDKPAATIDAEAWRQAQERRSASHADLLDLVASRARDAKLDFKETQYIDLVVEGNVIIEVKTLDNDDARQVRAALSQLYHYRFIHRKRYPKAALVAVFSRKPAEDLAEFLDTCGIAVVWRDGASFVGLAHATAAVPWLVDVSVDSAPQPELERTALKDRKTRTNN